MRLELIRPSLFLNSALLSQNYSDRSVLIELPSSTSQPDFFSEAASLFSCEILGKIRWYLTVETIILLNSHLLYSFVSKSSMFHVYRLTNQARQASSIEIIHFMFYIIYCKLPSLLLHNAIICLFIYRRM